MDGGLGTILIVEDEPKCARAVSRWLAHYFRPIVAGSLSEARRVLLDDPSLRGVILDISLPDGSGLSLMAELRRGRPRVPVLIVTGAVRPDYANAAQALGAEFVYKPYSKENFISFLGRVKSSPPEGHDAAQALADRFQLSPREAEVLGLAARSLGRREIGQALGISENTVKKHIAAILRKSHAVSVRRLARDLAQA